MCTKRDRESGVHLIDLPANVVVTASSPIIFDSRAQAVGIDGIVNNVTLTLSVGGQTFAHGALLGTGGGRYD